MRCVFCHSLVWWLSRVSALGDPLVMMTSPRSGWVDGASGNRGHCLPTLPFERVGHCGSVRTVRKRRSP